MSAVAVAQILAFPQPRARWRRAAGEMWPAWRALCRWEETSCVELGLSYGELVLLLWWVDRFGGTDVGRTLAADMLDGALADAPWDPLLEDIVECAFALGAGWAESRAATGDN